MRKRKGMRPEEDPSDETREIRIIFGLGNPGPEYARTPHNVGFWVLDRLAEHWSLTWDSLTAHLQVDFTRVDQTDLVLVRPLTYMNRAGLGLGILCEHLSFSWDAFCVVTDDWDLAAGHLRLRPSGGAGTHNGMRSLLETRPQGDFPRVRVGIRPPNVVECLRDYVIGPLAENEHSLLKAVTDKAADALLAWSGGESWSRLMSRVNGPVVIEPTRSKKEPLAPLNGG